MKIGSFFYDTPLIIYRISRITKTIKVDLTKV